MTDNFDVMRHLITCNSIRNEVKSVKLDHEIDLREFRECLNILSFVELSKGQNLQYVTNDVFDKYDLLKVADRQEAVILLGKTFI